MPHEKLQNKTFQQRFHFYLTKLASEEAQSSKPATANITADGRRANSVLSMMEDDQSAVRIDDQSPGTHQESISQLSRVKRSVLNVSDMGRPFDCRNEAEGI